MPEFAVTTRTNRYPCVVERGALRRLQEYLPARAGKVFVATTKDVWELHGAGLKLDASTPLFFPGGEPTKRLHVMEEMAEQMVAQGADRTSVVVALGGGIVGDMGGFLAAIFMRGIPVVQVPTTLLAQVDAAIGGKTGVNLRSGKNLIGSFHQPLAVLVDPDVLRTLPPREYRAGLYEVIKYGVIASPELFAFLRDRSADVLAQEPSAVERIVAESVRIKAEVVSADEKESDLRRILNFGHTVGHALESETKYERFLHGEAVAFGMRAATLLARETGLLRSAECSQIIDLVNAYGPIPSTTGITAEALAARLTSDKKTIAGRVHFVLPDRIGHVVVQSGIDESRILTAIRAALG
ncbi:MAG TPA: 3-dehydroquinate synthase [Bryobacteraceae bacterium]|nr:3-dehydroquinate synthase [Bryobacteraceae bacterium]